ncbi:MAG: sel1 repeat family protein [Bacteroides sp.]|nr:sel1 repeat family protein [Bacteroides sp.]
MKTGKIILLISILSLAFSAQAFGIGKKSSKKGYIKPEDVHVTISPAAQQKAENLYESVRKDYSQGKITADQVVEKAMYHNTWSPELAARCLQLVADKNARAMAELGHMYTYFQTAYMFPNKESEGLRLMETAANAGDKKAADYLGIYYNSKKKYDKAWKYFQSAGSNHIPAALTVMGEMYDGGKGVKKDRTKALEYYRQAALAGDLNGTNKYGASLQRQWYGKVNMPDAFFWTYISGELGNDFSRSNLKLPIRGQRFGDDVHTAFMRNSLTLADSFNDQYGHALQQEPIYIEGYKVGLSPRKQLAEKGDAWSLFYLGSMSYNNEFLKRSDEFVQKCYQPIVDYNLALPQDALAVVYERLSDIYRNSNEIKKDASKADSYARKAADLGSVAAYKIVEKIPE